MLPWQRSEELLSVGQTVSALSSLSEIFASKKFRQTPIALLEPIMLRFLDLCVILRKGRTAKEGLHTYKNVAQNASVTSVETVVLRYIQRSKEELEKALKQVDEEEGPAGGKPEGAEGEQKGEGKPAHTLDVEDLEESETPEGILLGSVTEDNSRDRKYRTLVAPWLRFLWEAYRNSLDILRNNSRLEVLYQVSICCGLQPFCRVLNVRSLVHVASPSPKRHSPSVLLTQGKPNSAAYANSYDNTSTQLERTPDKITLSISVIPTLSSDTSTPVSISSIRRLNWSSGNRLSTLPRISIR